MRKILLATSALVALAGAAHAAESPIQVTLGGYVDFRAAMFQESEKPADGVMAFAERQDNDFQTEYGLNIAADGKAAGGIEYGAKISLYNGRLVTEDTRNAVTDGEVRLDEAYIYMSGAWGKVLLGDQTGATDLFAYAPTVGEGQIDGSYTNFTDARSLMRMQVAYVDATETNTKITYYTPKVGNANHKVQLGASYTPNPQTGGNVVKYEAGTGYHDQIEAVAQYTGTFDPVSVVITPMIATGDGEGNTSTVANRDYTLWGIGAQAMYAGFTLGGSYTDAGHVNTLATQTQDQNAWTIGLKYEFDKVALAVNYLGGEGYYDLGTVAGNQYIDNFSALGLGATYTWFPGLTTAADAVFFDQSVQNVAHDNEGHVLMLSQKMTF